MVDTSLLGELEDIMKKCDICEEKIADAVHTHGAGAREDMGDKGRHVDASGRVLPPPLTDRMERRKKEGLFKANAVN